MPTIPHTFQDGVNETASGVQINENNAVLNAAIEALEAWRNVTRKATFVHHPTTEELLAGTWAKAPAADSLNLTVPTGGALALLTATVALVKAGAVSPQVWLSPVFTPTGSGLVGIANNAPPITDTALILGGPAFGWSEAGVSGSGNFVDPYGKAVASGSQVVWLPEGPKTLELLYTRGQAGDAVHNRFLGATLLGA